MTYVHKMLSLGWISLWPQRGKLSDTVGWVITTHCVVIIKWHELLNNRDHGVFTIVSTPSSTILILSRCLTNVLELNGLVVNSVQMRLQVCSIELIFIVYSRWQTGILLDRWFLMSDTGCVFLVYEEWNSPCFLHYSQENKLHYTTMGPTAF